MVTAAASQHQQRQVVRGTNVNGEEMVYVLETDEEQRDRLRRAYAHM